MSMCKRIQLLGLSSVEHLRAIIAHPIQHLSSLHFKCAHDTLFQFFLVVVISNSCKENTEEEEVTQMVGEKKSEQKGNDERYTHAEKNDCHTHILVADRRV